MKRLILMLSLLALGAAALQNPNLRELAWQAMQAHEAAQLEVTEAEELVEQLEAQVVEARNDVRRRRLEERAAAKAAADAIQEYLDWLNGPPVGRPGEELDWGVRPRPESEDIDWIVQNGQIRSTRGLSTFSSYNYGDAYRESRAAADDHVVFGIFDARAGAARVGGTWGQQGPEALAFPGDEVASATFVGLAPTSSLTLQFGSHLGGAMRTGDVMAFDLGLVGVQDSFAIRANGGSGHVQLDGCWFLHHDPNFDYAENAYASGMHIDEWDTLVLRRHQWRGETPGSPGLRLREHVFYLKGGRTSTLIEDCDLFGGNRTGFQKRPDARNQVLPTDRMMVRGNRIHDHATNHQFADGGGCFTIWVSSAGLYVYDNVATNFRYQALVISGQATSFNWPFLSSGNQHNLVHVAGNTFTPGPATERSTASFSSIDRLHLWDNTFEGSVKLDAQWNYNQNATLNGPTTIHLEEAPEWDLWKYDPALGNERRMTEAEVLELLQ